MFRIQIQSDQWIWILIWISYSGFGFRIRIPDSDSGFGFRIRVPNPGSESGSRRAKMITKVEKIRTFMFCLKCWMFSFKEKPSDLNREHPALQNRIKQDADCGSVSGCVCGSVGQWYGSEYPNPYQNVTDPQHWP